MFDFIDIIILYMYKTYYLLTTVGQAGGKGNYAFCSGFTSRIEL